MGAKIKKGMKDTGEKIGNAVDKFKDSAAESFRKEKRRPEVEEGPPPETGDEKLHKAKKDMTVIKDVTIDNVQKALNRGEDLEQIAKKSDQLATDSGKFRQKSKELKRKMWIQYLKMTLLVVVVVVALIYIILALACGGFNLPSCRAQVANDDTPPP